MSRREIRLRKEFLYKKQLQSSQLIRNEKKRKIRSAVERQTSIPTELIPEARALHHESEMDVIPLEEVQEEEGARLAVDDEYAEVGLKDPKVCVTTSRDPSSRLKQFAK